MAPPRLDIRFCKAVDGRSIAWARIGTGPPLVYSLWGAYFSHEFFISDAMSGRWISEFSHRHTLIVYDGRGTGLSDRSFESISIDSTVEDIESVVAAAEVDRVAVVASVHGAAGALVYAARHPERVGRLVIFGGQSRGIAHALPTPEARGRVYAMIDALEVGWDDPNPAFRLLNVKGLLPDAGEDEYRAYVEYSRLFCNGRQAASYFRSVAQADLTEAAASIRCPALLFHARGDFRVSFEGGRRLASLIPGARFVPLDSRNSHPVPSEPAWSVAMNELREFLAADVNPADSSATFADLTPRERDVVELLARGLDNLQIAAHLGLSEKSVRNRVSAIFDKLGVENRARAIVKAREAGFGIAKPAP